MKKPTLYFIGLGIYPTYIPLKAILILKKKVDVVFLEKYTSPIPIKYIKVIERIIGKKVIEVSRYDLEDLSGRKIMEELEKGKNVALLVPGDPMIATTHVALRILALSKGFNVEIIHGVSIVSAAISLSGLSPYRFGPIATITYPRLGVYSMRPYDIVKDNLSRNLHTLLLLDISDNGKFMTINEAIEIMLKLEDMRREKVFNDERVVLGLARVGYPNYTIKIGTLKKLKNEDFGDPPHVIIVLAKVNAIEYDVLTRVYRIDSETLSKIEILK